MEKVNAPARMAMADLVADKVTPGILPGLPEAIVDERRAHPDERRTQRRDKSRDGWRNRWEFFRLTHFAPLWRIVQAVRPLRRAINFHLINKAIKKAPMRPSPWSTRTDYTCWPSLVDRTYFSRHMPPPVATQSQPDLKLVTELFRRTGEGRLSPKSTALFSHFAQWFTDGFLRSARDLEHRATLRNTSNHEIDLSTLYGLNEEQTRALRKHEGGLLKSQYIEGKGEFPPFYYDFPENVGLLPQQEWKKYTAPGFESLPEPLVRESLISRPEQRNTLFAMGVERANVNIGFVMMNVLFLREHNRIARELQNHAPISWKNDDERLFQTARNILTVMLLKIVIEDYINHITPYHFKFSLVAGRPVDKAWYRTNWVAIEFNLLYRWHCLVPNYMLLGTQEVPVRVGLAETLFNNELLIAHGLRDAFVGASRQPAGTVGLLNTPPELLETEAASIDMGRRARLATYNEYRKRFGFLAVTSVDQISSNVEIRERLRAIYPNVNDIELYVGLFAEDPRPNSVLAQLMGRMVGIDALSQGLTNPLLAERIYLKDTFSQIGWDMIEGSKRLTLNDIVARNVENDPKQHVDREAVSEVSFTNANWRRE